MKSPEKNQCKGWFQKFAHGEIEDKGYESLCLWLIPILLRSRRQYYDDAIAETKKLIEGSWRTHKRIYPSFAEFEQSDFVQDTWERKAPLWWGINDIIGWIDVRICVRSREFQILLFLPINRISKKLKNKLYFCHSQETIELPDRATNNELRKSLIRCVEKMAADKRLSKRYIDLESWRRLVHHFDLIGAIRETAEADMELFLKEQNP